MKSQELLNEFTAFCKEHPELPFWRALLMWIQKKHDNGFSRLLVYKNKHLYDTFNWTGEDNPMVLFRDDITVNIIEEKKKNT